MLANTVVVFIRGNALILAIIFGLMSSISTRDYNSNRRVSSLHLQEPNLYALLMMARLDHVVSHHVRVKSKLQLTIVQSAVPF
jgi:hypothetical protein